MQKLHLNSPCPVVINRLKKDGNNFNCSSCNKKVTDYRNQSLAEVKSSIKKGECGIFDEEHITPIKKSISYHFLFKVLTILSFIGFNVQPINAQTQNNDSTSTNTTINYQSKTTGAQLEKSKPKKSKRILFFWRKKQKFAPVGCPSF